MLRAMRRLVGVLLFVACMGNSCFPEGGGVDGGYVGAGAPSLEVTVDGVHVGPAPATVGAYADLTTTRDALGQLLSTNLVIHPMAMMASCDIPVARFGAGVQPFRAAAYQLRTPLGDTTPEGTAAVQGGATVTAGALTLKCFGDGCNASVLAITVMDAAHVEGYLSGQLADPNDGQVSTTVCSFYVPWRTYQP